MIHLVIGTKAQYIKMAPVIRELERRGLSYRLVDTGQHAAFSKPLRKELGIREPDVALGGEADVASIRAMIRWLARFGLLLLRRGWIHSSVFGNEQGVVVVHGDTPSTLVGALLGWRAGLRIAHVEAGLRSHSLLAPFPEEAIRIAVMRMAHLLFSPSREATETLERMGVMGRIVELPSNTGIEQLVYQQTQGRLRRDAGGVVVTIHRVENLQSRKTLRALVEFLMQLAVDRSVTFVLHPPTKAVMADMDILSELLASQVTVEELLAHDVFVTLIADADVVITDGGSVQEECAWLGVPTLLWRERTERSDGIGRNVVLVDRSVTQLREALMKADTLRMPPGELRARPSEMLVDILAEEAVRLA